MLDPLVAQPPERAYMLAGRMRACAELGRLDDMVSVFTELREGAYQTGTAMQLLNGAMCAAAFTGRRAMVDKIMRLYGAALPADSARYWLAMADLAAGGGAAEAARAELQALARTTRQTGLARAIELRLQRPLAAPSSMDAVNVATVDAAQDVVGAMQAVPAAGARRSFIRRAPVTALLILANLLMFAVEMWTGDSMDGDTLYKLGAMLPDAVTQDGEWWRLGTALFLHAGPAHIAANMLALAVMGAVVERRYGALRFLLAYFIAGLGSMAAIIVFVHLGWVAQDLFVGASGAIMGLLGMDVVLILQAGRGAFARREDKAQIWVVLAVIALQTTFDLSHPQVSFAAHAGGLLLGLLTALAFNSRERHAQRRN
jgi:rhomboid protease GluP